MEELIKTTCRSLEPISANCVETLNKMNTSNADPLSATLEGCQTTIKNLLLAQIQDYTKSYFVAPIERNVNPIFLFTKSNPAVATEKAFAEKKYQNLKKDIFVKNEKEEEMISALSSKIEGQNSDTIDEILKYIDQKIKEKRLTETPRQYRPPVKIRGQSETEIAKCLDFFDYIQEK